MAKDEKKVVKEVKEKKEKGPSKSKITCVKCGGIKAVRPDVLEKRIAKAGSEEKLRKTYLCMKCRPKKEKVAKKKAEKKSSE